jgi:4-oxalocrotonate tautomerase
MRRASAITRAADTARVSDPSGEAAKRPRTAAEGARNKPSTRAATSGSSRGDVAGCPFYVRRSRYSAVRNAQVRETDMPEIYIHAVKGRTLDQKRALVKDITDAVVKNFSVPLEAVTVEIVESEPTAKAKGGVLFSEMRR